MALKLSVKGLFSCKVSSQQQTIRDLDMADLQLILTTVTRKQNEESILRLVQLLEQTKRPLNRTDVARGLSMSPGTASKWIEAARARGEVTVITIASADLVMLPGYFADALQSLLAGDERRALQALVRRNPHLANQIVQLESRVKSETEGEE